MKKICKQRKTWGFKKRINRRLYSTKTQISIDEFYAEKLCELLRHHCKVCRSSNIALGIGKFKNGRAPIYVFRK